MMDEPIKTHSFGLSIILDVYEDGRIKHNMIYINNNVPDEIIIMKIKVFLNNLEGKYFLRGDNR